MSEVIKCNLCDKVLKSLKGLTYHKQFCSDKEKEKFICNFCNRQLSTNHTLKNHILTCRLKEEKTFQTSNNLLSKKLAEKEEQLYLLSQTLIEKEKRIASIETENKLFINRLSEKEKIIASFETENKLLTARMIEIEKVNKNLSKSVDVQLNTINTLAQKSGNTTNTTNTINNINYLQPITKEDFEKLKVELIHDHDIVNEKQFARFCLQNGFNNKVLKTDHARKVITFVDEKGKQIKDPKAKELTEDIYKSTKTVFEEKAKQYEKLNDDQDKDRLDFYNNIVSVDKLSMEKFGDEIVKEANKKIKENINPIFQELREHITKSACYIFNQGSFDIGDWIYKKLKDKVQICRSNISIKKKYIIIRESKEKIDNKSLKEGIVYAFSISDFSDVILEQIGTYGDSKGQIEELVNNCKIVYDKIVTQKDENELDNIIIGMCG